MLQLILFSVSADAFYTSVYILLVFSMVYFKNFGLNVYQNEEGLPRNSSYVFYGENVICAVVLNMRSFDSMDYLLLT